MKRLGLFMTVIMILCITVNAQKQSNRTLVAYIDYFAAQDTGFGIVILQLAFHSYG
jgi:hypothetical protein